MSHNSVLSVQSKLLALLRFIGRVLDEFRRNQGLLLSGAIAYYTLLSMLPLMALLLVVLSTLLPEDQLLIAVSAHLELILPTQTEAVLAQVKSFLAHRQVVGWFGFVVLLFFSSMAFTALENAMSVIFHRRGPVRRHFLISAIIPYLFILVLGGGLLLVTFISGALQAYESEELVLFGLHVSLGGVSRSMLYVSGLLGLVVMMTALYLVMPVGKISPRHALVGGLVAALLWESARHILVWYFSALSLASVIYGSLATAILALISFDIAGVILLLGAQVIAETERLQAQRPEDVGLSG
jgi:membrane protein